MAQRRRRHLRRDVLVFLASTALHVALFFIAASEFTYYPPPPETRAPVEVQIVPEAEQPIPPPPIPIIKEHLAPTPTPAPPPTPQPQPPTPPKPQQPTPARIAQPAPVQSAPLQPNHAPALAPTPKPTLAPTLAPISPASPAPTPGPQRVTAPAVPTAQSKAFASPHIVLHRNRNEAGAPLAPSVSIPGAVEAPPQQASGAPNGAPGGPSGGGGARAGGGLPSGSLPGFGSGLRGSLLGCANAAALHLSRAEQAKCDEALGTGAHESPQMDAIGATKRGEMDREAQVQDAAQRYRDSTPSGSEATPIAGQPRILHHPGE